MRLRRPYSFLVSLKQWLGLTLSQQRFVLTSFPPLVMLGFRFAIASIVLLPFHWFTQNTHNEAIKKQVLGLTSKDWIFLFTQAISAGALFNFFMLMGLRYTDANVAGIITSALPAIIVLMSWFFLKERLSAQKGLCIAFACLGLIVISYSKVTGKTNQNSFLGDLFIFIALFPEAAYYVLCKVYDSKLPIFLTSSILNGINAIILIPFIFIIPWEPTTIPPLYWILISTIGLTTSLFYVFWAIGSRPIDTILASLTTAIMPVSTVVLAFLFLGEALSLAEFLGMMLVISSIFLYVKR